MSTLTATDIATLRKFPNEIELKLSIFRPTIVLSCQINQPTITKGARTITFNNVTSGVWTNVVGGMTMMVGTTPGGVDKGTIRVRSTTSTQITVAENSGIIWADKLYLTILNFFDVVPIFPRLITDPADEENPIFYKDYDIAYTNQNAIMGTLICMGSHREAEIGADGIAKIYYTASGTYNVNDETVTYDWRFPGSTITGSSALTPGYVNYNTPGFYVTSLTTTSPSGAVDKSYRYIIIDRESDGVKDWQLTNMQGSRSTGGYTASITIFSSLGFNLTPGTVMIITSKERYDTEIRNVGGTKNQENIFFVGYVLQDSIIHNYQTGSIEFQLGTVSELMKLITGFAVSLEDSPTTPTKWYQIKELNMKKAIYHYWKWHSTVLQTTDVQFIGNDWKQQFFDTNKESIYDAIASGLKSARMGELTSDRSSKLFAEISMEATPDAPTTYIPEMSIRRGDWMGDVAIPVQENIENAYLELGGIYYKGGGTAEGNSVPLLACAPGDAPLNRGKHGAQTGLSLQSQTQLNNLVGDVLKWKNYPYHQIKFDLRGNFKNFDIAPLKAANIYINPEDTPKNILINDNFYPTSINYKYNAEKLSLFPTINFEPITDGPAGDTIIVPVVTPTGPTISIPSFPTFKYPTITFPGQIVIPPATITPLGLIIILVAGEGVWSLDTVLTPTTWTNVTVPSQWTTQEVDSIVHLDVDPFGIAFMAGVSGSIDSHDVLNKGSRRPLMTPAYLYSLQGVGAVIKGIGVNPTIYDNLAVVAGHEGSPLGGNTIQTILINNGSKTPKFNDNVNYPGGGLGGNITYYIDKWTFSGINQSALSLYQFLGDLSGWAAIPKLDILWPVARPLYHIQATNADIIYCNGAISSAQKYAVIRPSDFTYVTALNVPEQNIETYNCVACDPTGQSVMFATDRNIAFHWFDSIWKSSDFGQTFTQVTLPSISWDNRAPTEIKNMSIKNLGDPDSWVMSFNANVQIDPGVDLIQCLHIFQTNDFGNTWNDIAENLRGLVPFNSIISVIKNA